jgi:type IV pilus assembly protein PilQ
MNADKNSITKIEAKALADETQLIIRAQTLPAYSLFKMTDPLIFIVDMADTRFLPSAKKAIPLNNDLVSYITFLNNEKRNLARLEIYLKQDITPKVTSHDSTLVVHLARQVAQQPKTEEEGVKSRTLNKDKEETKETKEEKEGPKYAGQKISLDFQEADIHTILRIMAEVSGLNIITSGDVKGNVTIRLLNVPWDQALDLILKTQGLGKEQVGNIIRVAPLEYFKQEQEKILAAKEAGTAVEELITTIVSVNYATADELQPKLTPSLSSRGSMTVDTRTNTLIIKDIEQNTQEILTLVKTLDKRTPQVAIYARIVELRKDYEREFGIQWGGGFGRVAGDTTAVVSGDRSGRLGDTDTSVAGRRSGNLVVNLPAAIGEGSGGAFGFVIDRISGNSFFNLDAQIEALENDGKLRVISAPRVTTLDNRQAVIRTGTSIPFATVSAEGTQTELIDAVTELVVTPHITADGYVGMKISASRNAPNTALAVAGATSAGIDRREADTEVLVKDGDTIVIGGMFIKTDSFSTGGIPYLKRIPLLGWLFRNEALEDRNEEVLIFITPRIVQG